MPTRSELAKIHIAKKVLKLTDDMYRRILRSKCGKDSARDMTSAEILRILSYFKNLGWRPQPPVADSESCADSGSHADSGSPADKIAPFVKEGANRSFPVAKKFDALGKRPGMASPAQLRKIEVMWMTGPGIREKKTAALRHFLQHHFGASDLRFITRRQAVAAIVAINKMNRPDA